MWSAAAEPARVTEPGSPDPADSGLCQGEPTSTISADALPSPLEAVATLLVGTEVKKVGTLHSLTV